MWIKKLHPSFKNVTSDFSCLGFNSPFTPTDPQHTSSKSSLSWRGQNHLNMQTHAWMSGRASESPASARSALPDTHGLLPPLTSPTAASTSSAGGEVWNGSAAAGGQTLGTRQEFQTHTWKDLSKCKKELFPFPDSDFLFFFYTSWTG